MIYMNELFAYVGLAICVILFITGMKMFLDL
nr:MAG TPA: hypothetical protein [Caudoviricetes sp.]